MAASPFLLEHCSQASITLDTDENRMPHDEKREDDVSSVDAL
jgi:hypothetical protein